ncbi:NADPH nitroreductase, putative [Entamoeba dispar SAW760]|uniref:NADPH nitroreductase, putative n=1 Tax=Entamoeba dispar (strain ATCC PRA-260 / SAW760) TaxID=370354 RepID=B0EJY1_ENTDS|nr:NADPH nitroreductase, putative [Entamoeba dispar SAW760]EDR25167.1 NADPH nitroreductase, putative [Entamoeba dispar SAW760]|eukprot:EDR25167.1 NADPH nitroreductase, putative [Entamoeba dispar SAW760]
MEALYRRSCRKFEDREVEREKVEQILKAGRFAPTGRNNQELIFHVIQNKELLQKLVKETQEAMRKSPEHAMMANNQITYGAPVAITMTCKKDMMRWAEFDCGFASQNMLVCCEMLGLGGLPLGIMRRTPEPWLKGLGCSDDEVLLLTIAIGYKDKSEEPHEKELKSEVVYIN